MKRWLPISLGAVAILVGAVWTLQGLGYLAGSAMTDQRIWAVIGPLVALAGLAAFVFGLRTRRE